MGNEKRGSMPTAPVVFEQKVHQDYMENESRKNLLITYLTFK